MRHLEHRLVAAGKSLQGTVSSIALSLMNLWKPAFFNKDISYPEHCDLATDFEECQLSCTDVEEAIAETDSGVTGYQGNWYGLEPTGETLSSDQWDVFFRSKVLKHLNSKTTQGVNVDLDEDTGRYYFTDVDKDDHTTQDELKAAIVIGVCRPGKIGEMMGPLSSAQDPIFFPIHTNMERIWQYARVKNGVSADWESDYTDDDDASTTHDFYPIGWNLDDPQDPFDYLLGMERSPSGSFFTNREINAIFNPINSHRLTYVYDHATFEVCTGADDDTR